MGGRTFNHDLSNGYISEAGGQWIGPGQTAVADLARELAVDTFTTYYEGETVLLAGNGRVTMDLHGTFGTDPRIAAQLNEMARSVPSDAPWKSKRRAELDAMTLGDFLAKQQLKPEDQIGWDMTSLLSGGTLCPRPLRSRCMAGPGWAREVVVTPGEITPASFSHPLLVTRKLDPQPVAADAPPDKAADADETSKPAILQAKLELRSTVGHPDVSRPATTYAPPASASPSEQTRTADASRAGSTGAAPRTMSDAAPDDPGSPQLAEAVATTGSAPSRIADIAAVNRLQAADPDKATPTGPELNLLPAPNRTGQISVLVSRKDAKLYVRQNFAPLFDAPIGIAASDRPLGTHVFTAEADKNDPTVLRWSVISLPTRYTTRRDEDERKSRRRKMADAVDTRPAPLPDSPTEALDRLSIPADAMARMPKVYRPAVRLSFPIKASPRVKPATERTSSFPYAKFVVARGHFRAELLSTSPSRQPRRLGGLDPTSPSFPKFESYQAALSSL